VVWLIKFWPSWAPGNREGALRRGENFWLCLTTASARCLRLCERFFIIIIIQYCDTRGWM